MISDPSLFKPGRNCILVVNTNSSAVAMGFDLEGLVISSAVALQSDTCCNRDIRIIGSKFNDQNNNGMWDLGEPGLPGWTITITDGINTWTTTTDALGNYYFNGLPAGTYMVSEVNQAGWTQTHPPSTTHTVTVAAGQIASNINFGNFSGFPPTVCDQTDFSYYQEPQADNECCWVIDINNNVPNYFTALELEGLGGINLTYNPADIEPSWIDNASGPSFVQLLPAPPLLYAPVGPTPSLIKFCVDNYTTTPQEVLLKWLSLIHI